MIPAEVALFRNQYRQANNTSSYSGWRRLVVTLLISVGSILAFLLLVKNPTLGDLAYFPAALLYGNFVEYAIHRFLLHRSVRIAKPLIQRHTAHHRYFTADAMNAESHRDFMIILFAPSSIVLFVLIFSGPLAVFLALLHSANAALLFLAGSVFVFLNYEIFHWTYHQPETFWVNRIPFMASLRRRHRHHHSLAHMKHHNFNVTYPLVDWLLGTGKGQTPRN